MKKAVFIFFAVVVLGLLIYFLLENRDGESPAADTFVQPEVEVATAKINSIENGTVNMVFYLLVENKMPTHFGVDSLQYDLSLENALIAESTYAKGFSIAASDSSRVSLPVSLYQDKISQRLQQAEQSPEDSIELTMDARIYTDLSLIKNPIELTIQRGVPYVCQPTLEVTNIDVARLRLDDSKIEVSLRLINPNALEFTLYQTQYNFSVDNKSVVEGTIEEQILVKASGTTTLTVPLRVNVKQIGGGIIDLLFNPNETPFDFSMTTRINSDMDFINKSSLGLTYSGKLDELVD